MARHSSFSAPRCILRLGKPLARNRILGASSANISYFTLTDNYIGITNLMTDCTEPVVTPEPSSLLLLGSGALGLAGAIRRKLL